jgi:maltose alpha-D-glucosyltransferase/alpha-amylase
VRAPAPSALVLVEVTYSGGGSDTYCVPMGVTTGPAADELQEARPGSVLCSVAGPDGKGFLHDGLASDEACSALLAAIEEKWELGGKLGVVRAFPTSAYTEARGDAPSPLQVTRGSAEQSNSSILYGGRMILKLFRRLEKGPNPDFEIGRFLTERARFDRIPKLCGGIEYDRDGEDSATLGMLQQLVDNQGDGWEATLEELRRYYEHSSTIHASAEELAADHRSLVEQSELEVPAHAREKVGIYLDSAAKLGKRTAEMHLALASDPADPAFAPEPLTPADLEALSSSLRGHAADVFEILKGSLSSLPDEIVEQAALVLGQRRRLLARFGGLDSMNLQAARTRIHGDYHLGQVLWVESDFVILDFEGEPARPLAERRLKQSPLKDVAGMLRSFSYAAYSSLLSYTSRHQADYDRFEPLAAFWEKWTSVAFLASYRNTAAGALFLPAEPGHFARLLDAFLLDKALYELSYELNNRPTWVRIPLRGILGLTQSA